MNTASHTRHKLDEAGFFLGKMEADYWCLDFDYYLSAFVGAARAVLWIMRNEYHDVEGWAIWYDSKTPEPDEQDFLRRINEVRVRSEKKAPVTTYPSVTMYIPKEHCSRELDQALKDLQGKQLIVTLMSRGEGEKDEFCVDRDKVEFVGQIENVVRTIAEFPAEDVLEICRKYYQWLVVLVDECEELFAQGLEPT